MASGMQLIDSKFFSLQKNRLAVNIKLGRTVECRDTTKD
jgi:hypothetical protein